MTGAPPPSIVLYSRPGCHLCGEARAMLDGLLAERAARDQPTLPVVERDITADAGLERRFFATIPVVELGDERLELVTSLADLRRFLAGALDGAAATSAAPRP